MNLFKGSASIECLPMGPSFLNGLSFSLIERTFFIEVDKTNGTFCLSRRFWGLVRRRTTFVTSEKLKGSYAIKSPRTILVKIPTIPIPFQSHS